MKPLLQTAYNITILIFSQALEKSGEKLGEAVSEKIGQMLKVIREKFHQEGVEGKLIKAEQEPSEKNKTKFKQELVEQMEEDRAFAEKLKALVDELKSDKRVNQIFLKNVNVKGGVETGDVELTAERGDSVNQEAVTEVEVGKDLKTGNVKLQS